MTTNTQGWLVCMCFLFLHTARKVRWESLEIRLGNWKRSTLHQLQWYLVDSQTQVTVQQSTLTSVTLERDELTGEKATLEHKCTAAESQINNLQVSNPLYEWKWLIAQSQVKITTPVLSPSIVWLLEIGNMLLRSISLVCSIDAAKSPGVGANSGEGEIGFPSPWVTGEYVNSLACTVHHGFMISVYCRLSWVSWRKKRVLWNTDVKLLSPRWRTSRYIQSTYMCNVCIPLKLDTRTCTKLNMHNL